MNDTRRTEIQAIHTALLVVAEQIGQLRGMLSTHPDLKKALPAAEKHQVIPSYSTVKHVDLGQGQTRTFYVTYRINPDGRLEIKNISVSDSDSAA